MKVFVVVVAVVLDWIERMKVMVYAQRGCLICQYIFSQKTGDERRIEIYPKPVG